MPYRTRLRPLAAAIAALFSPLAPLDAFAQSKPPAETTLPEVKVQAGTPTDDFAPGTSSVGGRTPAPVRDIPQTVNVINRAVMESQGAASLADALRSVPGITMGAAEGGSIGNNFNLRGFSARTDLYLDGMRDRGQVYRDVFSLEQIEVLKGPSSMLFGRGSTGGVINQVSKVPDLTPRNEASVTLGTQPSLRMTADFNQPLSETSAFRISMFAQDVNSTRDVMENKDIGIAPSLRFGINTPTEVTLSALLTHNRDMPDYGLPPLNGRPAPVDRHNFYGLTDDRTIQDVGQFTAKVVHKITPTTTLQNQTRFAKYSVDARESGPNSVGTVAGGVYTAFPAGNTGNNTNLPLSQLFVAIGSHDRKISDEGIYNQTDYITRFETPFMKHELVIGLEAGKERNSINNTSRNIAPNNYFIFVPLLDPGLISGAGLASTQGNIVNSNANIIAPYVNDTIALSPGVKFVAGLRHDHYQAELSNSVNLPRAARQTVGFNSVRTGLIYQPTQSESYYASYGTSFNPSLEALTLTNGTQSLDPEKSKSYELGAKWDLLNGNLAVSSSVFEVDKVNARTQIAPGVFDLTGEVRVRGFEAGVAGRPRRDVQVLLGYTYLDATVISARDGTAGKTLANTPEHSISAWTTYNIYGNWEIGGGLNAMSSRFNANNNAVKVPDYYRWDAMVAYRRPKYDLRLNVLNLTDRLNFDQAIASDRGRSVPGIDRTFLLSYSQRF